MKSVMRKCSRCGNAGLHEKKPSETLDSSGGHSEAPTQAVSSGRKDFGQPVVSSSQQGVLDEGAHDGLLTPAQAAACFRIAEYLLRKACAEGHLEHLRVVNALWISPAAVAAFARAWRAKKRPNS
jgi:hypothetical protein